jgi:hypothetical protein
MTYRRITLLLAIALAACQPASLAKFRSGGAYMPEVGDNG